MATRTALSPNYTDVNNAVNGGGPFTGAAGDGDTVLIPPGVSTPWAAKLLITKNITLEGASRIGNWEQTVITGGGLNGGFINWKTNNNQIAGNYPTATLKGFTLRYNDGGNDYPIALHGSARFNGTDGGFRMTEVRITPASPATGTGGYRIYIFDWITGVIDHCFLDIASNAPGASFIEFNMPAQPGFTGSGTVTSNKTSSISISQQSPGRVSWGGHGLIDGQGVMFTTTGTLPVPIVTNKVYFINVIDANFFTLSLVPFGTPINTTTAGSGTGHTGIACANKPQGGYYSYVFPHTYGADPSNSEDMVFIEDCLLQKKGFSVSEADGPPITGGGGGRLVFRHNSTWGAFNCHGFDESGGNVGGSTNESYNNFYYNPTTGGGANHNIRSGAIAIWNERYLQIGPTGNPAGYPSFNRGSQGLASHLVGVADGTCWFDQNARGGKVTIKTTLPTSQTYTPYETTAASGQSLPTAALTVESTTGFPSSGTVYVNTVSNGTRPFAYTATSPTQFTASGLSNGTGGAIALGAPVVGPLIIEYNPLSPTWSPNATATYAPVTGFQADGVSPTVPNDTRVGAIYAQGTNGFGANADGTPSSATVPPRYSLPFNSTAKQWTGFSLRNATQGGSEGATGAANGNKATTAAVTHVVTSNAAGNPTLIDPLGQHDPYAAQLLTSQNWELRYVVNAIGSVGGTVIKMTDGGTPRCKFFEIDSNGKQQYWPDQRADGIWFWDTKDCSSIAALSSPANVGNSTFAYDLTGVSRWLLGGAHNAIRTGINGANQDIPVRTGDGAAYLRIGADWDSGTFGGVRTDNSVVATLSPTILPTHPNTSWRPTAAYGAVYPHPLVSGVNVVPQPRISSASTVSFTSSGQTFPITTQNFTNPPTFATTALPTGVTLNATTGVITYTTGAADATYNITITATNTLTNPDEVATGPLAITITTPHTNPTVTITTLAASYVAPASIQITASPIPASGSSITQVDFYRGVSTLIGSATTSPWVFNWLAVPVGSYSLTAIATDSTGAASAASPAVVVNVVNQPPPPSAPSIAVITA